MVPYTLVEWIYFVSKFVKFEIIARRDCSAEAKEGKAIVFQPDIVVVVEVARCCIKSKPINPAAPVMRIFIRVFFSKSPSSTSSPLAWI